MRPPPDREEQLEIPLTSLLDAMFILIIFFVVTTTMKKVNRELPIELPPATVSEKKVDSEEILVISVAADGQKFINAQPVSTAELLGQLREEAVRTPDRRVRIDADRNTPYYHVIEAIEAIRFNGLQNVGFRTSNEPAKSTQR